jgi:hypothetical protein
MARAAPSGSPGVGWGIEPRTRRPLGRAECQESRVRAEARDDVVLFQRECTRVLGEHFARKHRPTLPGSALPAPASAEVLAISEQIADLSAVVNLLREHLAGLLSLPGQVAGLSAQLGETHALVEVLAERQTETETRLDQVDMRTARLTPAHARQAQAFIDRIVRETQRLSVPVKHKHVYGRIRAHFDVSSYKEVADERFEELMAFLRSELVRATSGESPQQGSLF